MASCDPISLYMSRSASRWAMYNLIFPNHHYIADRLRNERRYIVCMDLSSLSISPLKLSKLPTVSSDTFGRKDLYGVVRDREALSSIGHVSY